MKILRFIGYYTLILCYYLICGYTIHLAFYPPGMLIGNIFPFLAFLAIISPFIASNFIINKFYYGIDKKRHAMTSAGVWLGVTLVRIYHDYNSKSGIRPEDWTYFAFCLCLFVSLRLFNTPGSIKHDYLSGEAKAT